MLLKSEGSLALSKIRGESAFVVAGFFRECDLWDFKRGLVD